MDYWSVGKESDPQPCITPLLQYSMAPFLRHWYQHHQFIVYATLSLDHQLETTRLERYPF